MNEEAIADLKQFIAAIIAQHTSELRAEIVRVEKKIDYLSEQVAEAIDTGHKATNHQLQNHEQRIQTLETKTA